MKHENSCQCSIPGSHTKEKCCEPDASTISNALGCTCNKTDNISVISTDTPGDKKDEQNKISENTICERTCKVRNIEIYDESTLKKIAEFDKGEISFHTDDTKNSDFQTDCVPKTDNYNTTDDLTPQDISYWTCFGHFEVKDE